MGGILYTSDFMGFCCQGQINTLSQAILWFLRVALHTMDVCSPGYKFFDKGRHIQVKAAYDWGSIKAIKYTIFSRLTHVNTT